MSDAARLIEKFTLCIHGEEPEVVVTVLVAFVQTLCAQWNMPIEQFVRALVSPGQGLDTGKLPD